MKVLSVVGVRPEFIQAHPVTRRLRVDHEEILVHTGQHYDTELSDVFFDELDLPEPEYDLEVGSGPHGEQTAAMMAALEPVIAREAPDVVLVYGDTNTTLAAALVTSKLSPGLAHVEAGLRTSGESIPEEMNRVLVDHASDILLAPTGHASRTLEREGITDNVYLTGDVMFDSILELRERAGALSTIRADIDVDDGEYVLATVHRPTNTENPERLASIIRAFIELPYRVVFTVHPRTRNALSRFGLLQDASANLTVLDPVGYLDFIHLLDGAARVATDSGGVQKQAFFLDIPCVTLRSGTEWTGTVEHGWNVLADADTDRIVSALSRDWQLEGKPDLFGDGTATSAIVAALEEYAAPATVPR